MKPGNTIDFDALRQEIGDTRKESVAKLEVSDADISGGRKIVNAKSNQLFTGRFETRDAEEFIRIWNRYQNNNLGVIKNLLLQECDTMIRNYHGEVCPIEVMLYTSNVIASYFSNPKLMEDIADVVYVVWKKEEHFLDSIEHIVKVWRWEHVINVCAIAVGKICADVSYDEQAMGLMHFIYNNYRYNDVTRYGCFVGAMMTRKEEFVPDILSVVHDLSGTDADKIIGNLFKNKFAYNFQGYYTQLNAEMFADSPLYARELLKKILADGGQNGTLMDRYQKAQTKQERQDLIDEAIECVGRGQSSGIYDAINMLRRASNNEVNERMYQLLRLEKQKGQHSSNMLPIISYFGSVSYSAANRAMKEVEKDSDLYSACRIALFKQGVITCDQLMAGFLSETRPNQIKNYLTGFGGMNDKVTEVKEGIFAYFSKELKEDELRCAIANYAKLLQKHKRMYNPQVGEIIMQLFGFGTELGLVKIRMQEQNACLGIIEMIIDTSNYKKYEDFLYYVAEQGISFNPNIRSHAREILRNTNSDKIKL